MYFYLYLLKTSKQPNFCEEGMPRDFCFRAMKAEGIYFLDIFVQKHHQVFIDP